MLYKLWSYVSVLGSSVHIQRVQIESAHEVGSVSDSDQSDNSNTSSVLSCHMPYKIHIATFA